MMKHISGFGNYTNILANIYSLKNKLYLKKLLQENKSFIAYGNGKSYGDSALAKNIIQTNNYNNFLSFDENKGLLHVEAGVLLAEILDTFVNKGWFLKVSPGTKLITVGGAIASDVHGKNHHKEGCFSNSLEGFNLMLSNGEIIYCQKGDPLFLATCGGMGLTGIILDAKIYLTKIQSKNIKQNIIRTKNLEETFLAFEQYQDFSYSVAWLDGLAQNKDLGRGLLMLGEFIKGQHFNYKSKEKLNIPCFLPSFSLNQYSLKAFNYLYYNRAIKEQITGIDNFFYPLDSIANWNRLYGAKGFIQYQFVLPKENSFTGLNEILSLVQKNQQSPCLAVLKLFGPSNANLLSFPLKGYSLALDFKVNKNLLILLDKLDKLVLKYKGRLYLTKDIRAKRVVFDKSYSNIDQFRQLRLDYNLLNKFNSLQSKRLDL